MKRPLAVAALLYGGGILLAELVQPPLWPLFIFTLALGLTALVWTDSPRYLLSLSLVCGGWLNQATRIGILSPYDLREFIGDSARIVTLRARLTETPSQRMFVHDEKESYRSLAQVDVSAWMPEDGEWQEARGLVLVLTPGRLPPEYYGGGVVEITGVLSLPPGRFAEGLFDYRSYLRRQGIHYQLKASSYTDWRLLSGPATPPLSDRFLAWAQATLARGLPQEDESLHLLWAMTLGWKTTLTQDIYEPFMRSGTMHIFAISGLHIALIAAILVSLLRVLQVTRGLCGWLIIPLIWLYTAATGWQPSAIRSTIMMSIIIVGWALKRPSDLINSLAGSAFVILLWDPQQLFGASFQLSFFVVLSIALLLPPIERIYDRWLAYDPLLPPELVPRTRRWIQAPLRWLLGSVATSLAAWLGSLPLTAFYFHLFSPITLLANLFIVPLSGFALACNLGSLICGDWLPWLTELFNHSGWWWMRCMIELSDWATLIPKAYLYVRSPSAVDFLVYYSVLLASLSGWLWAPARRRWAAGACAAIVVVYLGLWHQDHQTRHLVILPLNGGASIYSSAAWRHENVLIDTGDTNSVELITKPFLRGQGVNRLPDLVLTHGDVRHVGGAQRIVELFSVEQICVSAKRFRSPAYRRALAAFQSAHRGLRTVNANDTVGPWTVLYPAAIERFTRADDNAMVLFADCQGTRVLLLSDLGRQGQDALLAREPHLRADIVVTGLPTTGEPLCPDLLETVRPRLIIVADSEFPANERASAALRKRLAAQPVPVLYTRLTGVITIEFRGAGWALRTMQ